MKCSFGISDFLEEISSLSHSVVFLYFFALVAEEGFLISSCYSLELCIQKFISFLFSFAFRFSSQLFVRHPQTAILLFCISFPWGWSWSLPPVQCHKLLSIVLQALYLSDLIPWIYFLLPLYNHKGFDLVQSEWSTGFPYFIFEDRYIQNRREIKFSQIELLCVKSCEICVTVLWSIIFSVKILNKMVS